jgi:hypothetical protein
MDKKETNRFLMYRTLLSTMDSHRDLIESNKALSSKVARFKAIVDRIESFDRDYQNVSKGTTMTKQALKSSVVTFTDAYCGTLHNLGIDSGNQQLAALTTLSLSTLSVMRDSNLLSKAKDVAGMMVSNQVSLADYGITEEEISQYQMLISNYNDSLNNKEVKIDMATTSRDKLSEEFAAANKLLQLELDKMMKIMEIKQPAFYALYIKAREINDLGIRHIDAEIIEAPQVSETVK